jgi:hypothetical protein
VFDTYKRIWNIFILYPSVAPVCNEPTQLLEIAKLSNYYNNNVAYRKFVCRHYNYGVYGLSTFIRSLFGITYTKLYHQLFSF